jgi:hypothetical protein
MTFDLRQLDPRRLYAEHAMLEEGDLDFSTECMFGLYDERDVPGVTWLLGEKTGMSPCRVTCLAFENSAEERGNQDQILTALGVPLRCGSSFTSIVGNPESNGWFRAANPNGGTLFGQWFDDNYVFVSCDKDGGIGMIELSSLELLTANMSDEAPNKDEMRAALSLDSRFD